MANHSENYNTTIQTFLKTIPPIDQRAKDLPMSNANFVFIGSVQSWGKSALFSSYLNIPFKEGIFIKVIFSDQIFEGYLRKRLCCWGDEEYLERAYSEKYFNLIQAKYKKSLDVDFDQNNKLVMTYTPIEKYVNNSDPIKDILLKDALKIEIINSFENIGEEYFRKTQNCKHLETFNIKPDSDHSFLCRSYKFCKDCFRVILKNGSCARDACDCSKHDKKYF